jgi:mRNA interferase MazF
VERGEVWWAGLPLPAGRRPVLLLSRNRAYRVRRSITVAPVTRTMRGIPVEVPLDGTNGMPTRCAVNLDDILTIPLALLEDRITTLSRPKMLLVNDAITFALDLT